MRRAYPTNKSDFRPVYPCLRGTSFNIVVEPQESGDEEIQTAPQIDGSQDQKSTPANNRPQHNHTQTGSRPAQLMEGSPSGEVAAILAQSPAPGNNKLTLTQIEGIMDDDEDREFIINNQMLHKPPHRQAGRYSPIPMQDRHWAWTSDTFVPRWQRTSAVLGFHFLIMTLSLLVPTARGSLTSDNSVNLVSPWPMVCHPSSRLDTRSPLLMRMPKMQTCPSYNDTGSNVQPFPLQFYQQRPLLEQEKGYLCYKLLTTIQTFLYFFAEERIYHQSQQIEAVSEEECWNMVNYRTIDGHKIYEKDGVLSTHRSTEPQYKYCCKYFTQTVTNYVVEPGFLYLHRDTKQIRTSLGNTHGCDYKAGSCTLPHQGIIVWEPLRHQSCWFTTWSIKSGELHGINWLSSDKTLALNFTEHGFIPFRLCPDDQSQVELTSWKSD